VAVVAPVDGDAERHAPSRSKADEESWGGVLEEVRTLKRFAHARLAPGSTDPGVIRQRDRGKLTCRERIALLLDDGSFRDGEGHFLLRRERGHGLHPPITRGLVIDGRTAGCADDSRRAADTRTGRSP
jgi:acetyl-CoA carboxylase carboxyltransferase component